MYMIHILATPLQVAAQALQLPSLSHAPTKTLLWGPVTPPSWLYVVTAISQVYQRLAAVAAAGEQPMPLPVKRSLLPWQQQQSQVMHTWRLLDLTDIKLLYKDAQRHGTLHKQMKSSKQQLEHEAAANSNSRSTGNGQAAGSETAGDVIITGSSKRPIHSRLDEFLVVRKEQRLSTAAVECSPLLRMALPASGCCDSLPLSSS